ncbi:MAG: hypothetical protein ACLFPU_09620 [Dehalococcoidia bacterium]
MTVKGYILMNVRHGRSGEVMSRLWGNPGIVALDHVEGPPDMVMVVKAKSRRDLARITVKALQSVEGLVEGIDCYPVLQEGTVSARRKKGLNSKMSIGLGV